jgi:hypothetical protein
MTRLIQTVALATVILCGVANAQTSPATPSAAPANAPGNPQSALHLAPGSLIPVVLTHTLDAKKAKAGDSVQAKVADDLKTNGGQVIVPKDTIIVGHVTAVQPHSKGSTSELAVVFDHAVLKGGSSAPLPMSVQAIIGNNQNTFNSEPDASGSAPSGTMSSPRGGMGGRAPGDNSTTPGGSPAPDTGSQQAGSPSARPQITASTQGVIGISDLKLESSPQGAVITSEKSNVKLENGTFLLLRVIQQ